jgi:hypothetical protein
MRAIRQSQMSIPIKITTAPLGLSRHQQDLSNASRHIEEMVVAWRKDNERKTAALVSEQAAGNQIDKLLGEWSLNNARRARQLLQENISLKQAIFDLAEDNAKLKQALRNKTAD